MAVEIGRWLFQDRLVLTRFARVEHGCFVQLSTGAMLTLCRRPAARDADPARPIRRCARCFPTRPGRHPLR